MLEARRGEIGKENLSAPSGLPADVLGKVSYREIYGICCLAAKDGELCLVGRDDNGNNRRARLVFLELFLGGLRGVNTDPVVDKIG